MKTFTHQDFGTGAQKISLFAGNHRVSLNRKSGVLTIEAQVAAFRAGLLRAAEIGRKTGEIPSITTAFDHLGIFQKQFVMGGLTNAEKNNANLSQLRSEIVDVFRPASEEIGIPLHAVKVIHEDLERARTKHLIQEGNVPENLRRHMLVVIPEDDQREVPFASQSCVIGESCVDRLNCAAMASSYLSSGLAGSNVVEAYIERDSWSKTDVYIRGIQIVTALRPNASVFLRLVMKNGDVYGKKAAF